MRVNGVDVGRVVNVALSGSTEPNRVIRVTLEIEQNQYAGYPRRLLCAGQYRQRGGR